LKTTTPASEILTDTICYHCGEICTPDKIEYDQKSFCCTGCKLVYEILAENNLCTYYELDQQPGQTIKEHYLGDRFAYLDAPGITEKLQTFRDENSVHLRFHIPAMHCSSCIWLLENFGRISPGILRSQVDFIHKQFLVVYNPAIVSLRKIVESLTLIGYEPELNLQQLSKVPEKKKSRIRIIRIGVAGFAFGNIMLLSFPEYLAETRSAIEFSRTFGYLNLLLSFPVFFFSSWEFIGSAIKSFRQKAINIDVPLAIGIIAIFLRSVYEVLSGSGPGYFDSMTGLVFFMLIGRNFQDKTFSWLSFERDYNSYLPIAVTRLKGIKEESVAVNDLQVNDRIILRNQDIIPADITLLSEQADVDYSFITGESRPVTCLRGERVFAGARILGTPAEALVQKQVSQSYITQLWNQSPAGKTFISGFSRLTSVISKWFIAVTLLVAVGGWWYWYPIEPARAINAFTSVLVIACACALALSAPFTFGNMLRILGRNGIYLRNAAVIEKLADIRTVVFDKTGTLTVPEVISNAWSGNKLTLPELDAIRSVAAASNHPLSRQLANSIQGSIIPVSSVVELPGMGIQGNSGGLSIFLGKSEYCNAPEQVASDSSVVHVSVNGKYYGFFKSANAYRKGVLDLMHNLKSDRIQLAILSGDNDSERQRLTELTGQSENLHFNQRPEDKLKYIRELQHKSSGVLMAGDGLNDAGALFQSDVGLAVAADVNNFSPACDGILTGNQLVNLADLLAYARSGIRIIIVSFIISLLYNAFGLYYAVTGNLSPMFAAILMPISTTSLVLFTVLSSSYKARSLGFVAKP